MIPPRIAYFSMEIALKPSIPTYCGGLGILAGDTVRSAADLELPLCAVSLIHRKGYFRQSLGSDGNQRVEDQPWDPAGMLEELQVRAKVHIAGVETVLRVWKYEVTGNGGTVVPVLLLDADLPENPPYHRSLTDHLYGGDEYYRLCQEVILGMGGVRILRALGFKAIERFHMNEGHAALLGLELLREAAAAAGRDRILPDDIANVRRHCVFTTHTPVPAGHDQFPFWMVEQVIGHTRDFLDLENLFQPGALTDASKAGSWHGSGILQGGNKLHMTYLALNVSHYVNGVAKRHAEVSSLMFAEYQIDAITNGVHLATWTAEPFQRLFDRYIPGWRDDNFSLRYAWGIPAEEIWDAHQDAKRRLIEAVRSDTGEILDSHPFTIGFARRFTRYKRPYLLLSDPKRLRELAAKHGGIQIIFAGKAHPGDIDGAGLIRQVIQSATEMRPEIHIVYLENYGVEQARLLTSGVDLWLNTPLPPQEASGTSGMKAAINGVPSLSILDGWWIEGCIDGVTGWSFGNRQASPADSEARDTMDAIDLHTKLESILELFHANRAAYLPVMRGAIALNGSFFNTQRMLQQYVMKAYFE